MLNPDPNYIALFLLSQVNFFWSHVNCLFLQATNRDLEREIAALKKERDELSTMVASQQKSAKRLGSACLRVLFVLAKLQLDSVWLVDLAFQSEAV